MKPWQEEIMIGLTALGLLTVALAVVQLGNILGGIGEQVAAVVSTAVAMAAIGALSLMVYATGTRLGSKTGRLGVGDDG